MLTHYKYPAIVVVGPTGSGKSPLCDWLESHKLKQRLCSHFDFGKHLRWLADPKNQVSYLKPIEIQAIRKVLKDGTLLANGQFLIAARILDRFILEQKVGPNRLLVLNGLPRNLYQATQLQEIVDVKFIICLQCTDSVALERIRTNASGDRKGRKDDSEDEVKKRLAIFSQEILKLSNFYRERSVTIVKVTVNVDSSPETIWQHLEEMYLPL
ncbi:MAG: nucleoside monophosphate kinase [Patescibacteria group bacterium]